ncbi:ATP-binding cassette domain-containing protein [Peptostreptococcaceae bacterium OttesenSCG-928-C18]|nr:ATP-binding cassette domain-containing protein [Peptostreptococcaceae bacterium OttesenSCG-928-C18]
MTTILKAENLTKNYGEHRGIFDLSFEMVKGEVFGFLGPNGAGKTTTIRHLLGFSTPQKGSCSVLGFDCRTQQKEIQRYIGYVPGEIAFPDHLTGYEFLEQISDLREMTSLDRARELICMLEFDPRGELKRMSKGMKQKIALVTAFMHDPEIIILDEPTSGLDPLMQSRFVDLIKSEKARGKIIFMSSHMFDEVEKTCDRVAIIKQGHIVTEVLMKDIEHVKQKNYEIKLATEDEFETFASQTFDFTEINREKLRVKINIHDDQINELLRTLSTFNVVYISEIKYNLEQYFMHHYRKEDNANV